MIRRRLTLPVAVFLVVAAGSSSQAQQQEGSSSGQETQVEELAESEESLVEEDVESLPDEQKLDRAESKISASRKSLEQTNALLTEAREQEKDVMKINCINDKQAAIKGFLKVGEQSYVKLKNAVSDNDSEEANHHYTLISVSKQKIDSLTEEARMCAGEVQRYAEETQVEVDVDDNVAETDDDFIPEGADRLTDLPELTPMQ